MAQKRKGDIVDVSTIAAVGSIYALCVCALCRLGRKGGAIEEMYAEFSFDLPLIYWRL